MLCASSSWVSYSLSSCLIPFILVSRIRLFLMNLILFLLFTNLLFSPPPYAPSPLEIVYSVSWCIVYSSLMKLILLLLINLTRFLLLRALIFLLLQLPFPPEVRGVSDAHTHAPPLCLGSILTLQKWGCLLVNTDGLDITVSCSWTRFPTPVREGQSIGSRWMNM